MQSPEQLKIQTLEERLASAVEDAPEERESNFVADYAAREELSRLAELLGGDMRDVTRHEVALQALKGWAVEQGAASMSQIETKIRELAAKLGSPSWGENRIRFLYRYVYLNNESKKINEEISTLERLNKKDA